MVSSVSVLLLDRTEIISEGIMGNDPDTNETLF